MGVGVGRLGQGIVGYVRSVVHPFSRKWGHVMGKRAEERGKGVEKRKKHGYGNPDRCQIKKRQEENRYLKDESRED